MLHHGAFGEKDEVEKILQEYPQLLYKKGITMDPCRRKIEGTIYRIALGAKDVSSGQHEEMIEMIERNFTLLPNSEKEMKKQYAEQFPEDYLEQEKKRIENDSAELKKVFTKIRDSETNEDCEKAVKIFQIYLVKQTEGIIKAGYHFNDNLLAEAYELYESHYEDFGGGGSPKNNLAAVKIIGSIQCYLPECYVQAYCSGLSNEITCKNRNLI